MYKINIEFGNENIDDILIKVLDKEIKNMMSTYKNKSNKTTSFIQMPTKNDKRESTKNDH